MTGSSIKPAKQRPTKTSHIDRALGSTENIYYLLDKLYCLNFVVYAQIDGPFDIGRLAGALRAVQAEHPLLRARLALAGGRPWFKPVAADAHPIPIESGGLRDWRAGIEAQLERPFVDAAPLARFMCFGSGARKSVVAMVFHHAIADGRSGADVLIEVLRRAGGEDLPLKHRPAQPSAQALDLVKLGGRVGASMRTLGYWLQQGKSALKLARQLPGFDMAVRAERRIRVVPFTLPKAKARALLEACRAHGVTMQGALGATQLLAINDEFGAARSRNLGLNSLADLRGVLGGNLTQQDLGLYIATVTTVHAIAAEPEFWQLAADVRNQLKAVLD
ncbi:MAG: condensation domain-containing protein, partial [Rubrivivax sp.]